MSVKNIVFVVFTICTFSYTSCKKGCTDETAINYDSSAKRDDGSCIEEICGCMDHDAKNFNVDANCELNSSCQYLVDTLIGSYTGYYVYWGPFTQGDTVNVNLIIDKDANNFLKWSTSGTYFHQLDSDCETGSASLVNNTYIFSQGNANSQISNPCEYVLQEYEFAYINADSALFESSEIDFTGDVNSYHFYLAKE